jgi:hypothetical protein
VFFISLFVFFKTEIGNINGFVDLTLFHNMTFSGATLSNFMLNGAAGTLLVVLSLVQEASGLSSLQSGLLTVGYLVAVIATIRVGEKLLQSMGSRKPMLLGCWITGLGILLNTLTFLLLVIWNSSSLHYIRALEPSKGSAYGGCRDKRPADRGTGSERAGTGVLGKASSSSPRCSITF